MANLRTTTDILNDILERCGEPQNNTSDFYSQALINLNKAYQGLCSGGSELLPDVDEDWWWLRKGTPGVIILQPSVNTGTAAVTLGSATITLSQVPTDYTGANVSIQGWFFVITGDNGDVYQVSAHNSGSTNATLDSVYTSTTQGAAAFKAFNLQYPLASDCQRVIGPMRCYQESRFEIDYTEKQPMRFQYPLNTLASGEPRHFAMVSEQKVEFSHYPGDDNTKVMRVEYDYVVLPNDLVDDAGTSSPLTPYQYNRVLSDWGTYLTLLDKSDTKADPVQKMAVASLGGMIKENRRRMVKMGNTMGQIYPRQRDRWQNGEPLRTSSGLIIGW